jgi:hypothetical protein
MPRCACAANPIARGAPPLPDDPDEAMRSLRGCSLAEYEADREYFLSHGRPPLPRAFRHSQPAGRPE